MTKPPEWEDRPSMTVNVAEECSQRTTDDLLPLVAVSLFGLLIGFIFGLIFGVSL